MQTEEAILYEKYKAACIKHEKLTKIINATPTRYAERDVAYAEMRLAEKRLYLKIVGDA